MNQHTQGPWHVSEVLNGYNLDVYAEDGLVANVKGTSGTFTETQSNARLIALAPELLDELIRAERRLTGLANGLLALEYNLPSGVGKDLAGALLREAKGRAKTCKETITKATEVRS